MFGHRPKHRQTQRDRFQEATRVATDAAAWGKKIVTVIALSFVVIAGCMLTLTLVALVAFSSYHFG